VSVVQKGSQHAASHKLYGSELLRVVKHAVDDACADVRETGGDDGQISRLMMAVRLTTAVAEGELDPAKLKLVALDAVGFPASQN